MPSSLFFYLGIYCFLSCISCTHKQDHSSIDRLLHDAEDEQTSYVQREKAADLALSLVNTLPDDSLRNLTLFKVANRYWNINNIDKYKKVSLLSLELATKREDSKLICKGLLYIGDYYQKLDIYDSAFYYYKKSEKQAIATNDSKILTQLYLNYSNIMWSQKDYFKCEAYALQALKFERGLDDYGIKYEALVLLAITSQEMEDYKSARNFYKKTLEILNNDAFNLQYPFAKVTTFNNIGNLYQIREDYAKSLLYFERAIKKPNLKGEEPYLYAILQDNIAYSNFKTGNFAGCKEMFLEAIHIKDSIGEIPSSVFSSCRLGEYYLAKKRYCNRFRMVFQGTIFS